MNKGKVCLLASFFLLNIIIQGINLTDSLKKENQLNYQNQEVPSLASNNYLKVVGKDISSLTLSNDTLRLDSAEEKTPHAMTKPKIASNSPINVACVFAVGGLGDNSFNDMAYTGLNKALTEGLCTFNYSEPSSTSEYLSLLTAYASSGSYDLIVAVGFAQKTAVTNISAHYPNQAIALIDEIVDQGNVSSLVFKEQEGSFLAGALAGLMTNTGRVGFIGGMDLPLIRKFWAGFAAGIFYEKNNSYIEVFENFVGAWNDPTTAKYMAEDMWNEGIDIIYAAAGGSGLGVLESVNEQGEGFFAIGVDADQDYLYPGRILTSMMKRVDIAVYNAIKDVYDSTWSPDIKSLGLEENGVGLSPLTYTKDVIGSDIIQEVNVTLRNKIINNEISVPTNESNLEQWLVDMNIVKNSFTPRGSIVITSNSQFEALFDGSGTSTDPYLIEGYYINDSSGPSISIHGTSVHFRISDNILNGLSTINHGIDLQNVDNGVIAKNTIYSTSGNGLNSLGCSNFNITDNFIHTNSKGIYLNNSNCMFLLKNVIFNNTFGLDINNTFNETITNNRLYNNNHDAIRMWHSYNNTITGNIIYNTGASGLSINTAVDIKVLNNQFYENDYALHTYLFNDSLISGNIIYNHLNQGMRFWACITNTIFNNTIENSGEDGIGLHSDANNNTIINNTFSSCDLVAIRIEGSLNNRVINNTAYDNSEGGFWLDNSNLNYIEGNNITTNGYSSNPGGNGIFLNQSDDSIISNNTVFNNSLNGIYLYGSDNNTISDNEVFYNHEDGIALNTSDDNRLLNNTIHHNGLNPGGNGIFLDPSNRNTITNNTIYSNGEHGIFLQNSALNHIEGNNITANGYTGNPGGNGIFLDPSDDNTIINNYVFNNSLNGIYLYDSENNTVSGNEVSYNHEDGVALNTSDDNQVLNNTIHHNGLNPGGNGIFLDPSNRNIIANNTIYSNGEHGIFLQNSILNHIEGNNITANGYGSNPGGNGIFLDPSDNNTIIDNYVFNNSLNGIYLYDSENNTVSGNEVSYNHEDGVALNTSDDNQVLNNSIHHNGLNPGGNGVFLDPSNRNIIAYNTIYSNGECGIYLLNSGNTNIYSNVIYYNELYGIKISSGSNDIIVSNNDFIGNNLGGTSQAYDDGSSNVFTNNFFIDHDNDDSDHDGVADTPYPIDGSADNFDSTPSSFPEQPLEDLDLDLEDLVANTKFYPKFLDLENDDDNERWVTVCIILPEGYSVTNIDIETVHIDGYIYAEHSRIENKKISVQFDRQDFIAYLKTLDLDLPCKIIVNVTGFFDGNYLRFNGISKIWVFGDYDDNDDDRHLSGFTFTILVFSMTTILLRQRFFYKRKD